MPTTIPPDDPVALAVTEAIQQGDLDGLHRLLEAHPGLAAARLGTGGPGGTSRTLLHVATDWPGHLPHVAAAIRLLVAAGADPNSRFRGPHTETPLHWAASADDLEALDALLDAGADIDADGAVIAGGTPLMDATAFGQWRAADRLVQRGATTGLWDASALGLDERVTELLDGDPPPSASDVTGAFWGACHGGRLATARLLLARGADPHWLGWDGLTPLGAATRASARDVVDWLADLRSG